MSNTPLLVGDVPLPQLLQEHPGHGFDQWVIDSYLEAETLRSVCERAEKVRLLFCGADHALHPDGPYSEQLCRWRKENAVCLHGEQWDSGLGIIRQCVQSARGLGLSTQEELQYIIDAQDVLGKRDFATHMSAPAIREGRIELKIVEAVVEKNQDELGKTILAIRDTVVARVREKLDTLYV
jgi:hypothetical protein